jgi:hypothetical protein
MQYGFYINQKAMVDLRELTGVKLDHSHAAIVNFIKDFAGTGELETRIIDDKSYYWLSYGKISEEMPLYDWEKDTIYRKMKQLVQAKILEHFYDDKEQKSYYAFGENYIYIVKPTAVPTPRGSENNPKGVGLKSEGGSENNPYNHNTNTISSEKIEKGESEVTCEYDVDNSTQPDFEAETDSVDTPALDFTQTWEPNPMYHQATQRACPDMTQPDFEAELIKFRLFYENDWPKHPDKTWLSWCQRANGEYRERTQRRIKSEETSKLAQTLAKQRVHDFHTKKKQNIQKVGTKFQKPKGFLWKLMIEES